MGPNQAEISLGYLGILPIRSSKHSFRTPVLACLPTYFGRKIPCFHPSFFSSKGYAVSFNSGWHPGRGDHPQAPQKVEGKVLNGVFFFSRMFFSGLKALKFSGNGLYPVYPFLGCVLVGIFTLKLGVGQCWPRLKNAHLFRGWFQPTVAIHHFCKSLLVFFVLVGTTGSPRGWLPFATNILGCPRNLVNGLYMGYNLLINGIY